MPSTAKAGTFLKQLRSYLPRLLRDDPEVRGEIIGMLSEYLTTREETAAILVELRQMRADFDRRMESLKQRMGALERTLGAIGARWGIMTEDAFRRGVRALFADQPDLRVEQWRYRDEAGRVFGYPADIELDAVIRNGLHVLVEIKSSVSAGDVVTFARKGELYTEVTGQRPQRRLIISPFVDERAVEAARRLGVEVHASATPPAID